MKVAVTGGCSSGKSTVCQVLEKMGAGVVYTDDIVKSILGSHSKTTKAIIELLGNEIISQGKIDKGQVARLVFSDKNRLEKLESILHPEVFNRIKKTFLHFSFTGTYSFLLAEVPLLYEAGYSAYFDVVVVVLCEEEMARERSPYQENFSNRMARMWPQENKAMMADYIIKNNGTLRDLHDEARVLYQKLINRGAQT